jgi:hypothetical protein
MSLATVKVMRANYILLIGTVYCSVVVIEKREAYVAMPRNEGPVGLAECGVWCLARAIRS